MGGIKSWLRGVFGQTGQPEVPQRAVAEPEAAPEPVTVVGASAVAEPMNEPASWESPGSFSVGWRTDVGRVRGHNEDAIFVFTGEQESSNAVLPFGLFMLADGMGGHQSGEVASALALRESARQLMSHVYLPMLSGADRGPDQPSLTDVVREAISRANRAVTQGFPGSGCTLTCGLVLGDRLFIGHVGDSRAYFLRKGKAPQQLTKDHSLVNRLIEMGQLTEEEAAVHPQRNVLYRAIGQGSTLEVDVLTYALAPGDRLLLCSDGLWGLVPEKKMWRLVEEATSPLRACNALVDAANAAGGADNISVVLVEAKRI